MGKKEIYDVRTAKEVMSKEQFEEILDKEWAKAKLPSEEELAKEKPRSPNSRNNPNSRANLVQYRTDVDKEVKEKIVKNLRVKRKRKSMDLKKFFGSTIKLHLIPMLEPEKETLDGEEEEAIFFGTIKGYLEDIPHEELTFSDLDDVVILAKNKILELRILKQAKKSPKMIMDASNTIDKIRKNSEKLKMNLASRRTDRVDTKNKQSFSIVDLAVAFDAKRKEELEERAVELKDKQASFRKRKNKQSKEMDSNESDNTE